MIGDLNPGSKATLRSKADVRGAATARGTMEKSRYVKIIKAKQVRRDDPIK